MRVDRLQEEFDLQFDVCAFNLRPDVPAEGMPRDEASRGRVYPSGYLENMRQMARESGIEMKRPPLIPNTRKAHEATEFAREKGRLLQFHRAVFRAYWEDERDIGDSAVLCEIAAGCGLPAGELRQALADERYAATVQAQMDWSREAGVSGVPTVIFEERFAVVGAQDYEVFRDVAQRVTSGVLPEDASA